MPRSKGHVSEAELRQAIRSIRKVFGAAAVVFDTDGTVRVEPFEAEKYAKEKEDKRRASRSGDILDLVPSADAPKSAWDAFHSEIERRHREWQQELPGTPLGKRERKALDQLRKFGVGTVVPEHMIKDCGWRTVECLLLRGYIELAQGESFPGNYSSFCLTPAGYEASNELPEL